MAGTVTMVSIAPPRWRAGTRATSKTGMITAVPPTYSATQQLAVAAGHVEQRDRDQGAQAGGSTDSARRQVSALDRKFSWLVTAPLGKPGGAAGVEDRGRAGRLGVVDDQRVAVGQRGSGREHVRRAGVGHHVVRFLLGEAGVDRHHDRVGQHGAEEGQHPVDAVAQPDRHPVTALDAEAAQAARHPGGAVPQRGVAQPRAAAGLHHGLGRALLGRPPRGTSAPGCGAGPRTA